MTLEELQKEFKFIPNNELLFHDILRYIRRIDGLIISDNITLYYAYWDEIADLISYAKNGMYIKKLERFMELYHQIISPNSICIDIGAHTGDSTLAMGLLAGKDSIIHAFEPCVAYQTLNINAQINCNLMNIIPHNCAITEKTQKMKFVYGETFNNGGALETSSCAQNSDARIVEVQGYNFEEFFRKLYPNTFDDFLNRICFIKIDTEGYDYKILNSMSHLLLTKFRPKIMIEWWEKYTDEIFQAIEKIKYKPYNPINLKPINANEYISDILLIPENI